ncbi:TPA: hypothetical protein L5114_001900 [Escherichia coli]|nr:hypothetical protein [Escherichia coli]
MTELTKEWLQNTITGIESAIDDKSFVCNEIAFKIGEVNNALTAFKVALASLEAEPVAWTDDEELSDIEKYGFGEIFQRPSDKYEASRCVIPLYRVLPAPVVPDEGRDQFEALVRFHVGDENHETLLLRANEGMNYRDPDVDFAWIFWKSSREHLLRNNDGSLPESGNQVRGLTLLVKRLASSLKSVNKSSRLPDKAMKYLKQNGLISVEDILR